MAIDWDADGTALWKSGSPGVPQPTQSGIQSGGLFAGAGIDPSPQQPQVWNTAQLIKGWNFQQTVGVQALLEYHGYLSGDYHRGAWSPKSIEALEDAMEGSRTERMEFMQYLLLGAPRDLADAASGGGAAAGPDLSPKTYTEDSTSTSTNRQINLTSRAGARAVLVGALATELGREPTRKEVSLFLRNLNRRERNNPAESTTVTNSSSTRTVDPSKSGSHTTSSSTSDSTTTTKQPNIDPQAMGERFAKQENPEEWRMFQNAQYFDVLAQLLGM